MKGFFVTTAIDYVNGKPHLGHAYEKIGADVLARFKRLRGEDVFFLVGTDEHSLNVAKSAAEAGLKPKEYCDRMAKVFREIYDKLQISYDRFIRTSDKDHEAIVRKLVKRATENGYVYEGKYEGWYCQSCEAFLEDSQLVDGKCPVHKNKEVQWVTENNYFFALSKLQERLLAHIESNPEFILPESRRNEVVSRIKEGLRDVSISRSSVDWGIPLPQDESQVIYVWVDALISYVTASQYIEGVEKWWPANYHIIGKDILWFHCVIWPAFLMAVDLPLPGTISAHGFINSSTGEKLSKSAGICIDPLELSEKYGVDTLRYYLAKTVHWGRDGNFSIEDLEQTYNTDLANDYGNLLSRTVAMVDKYFNGIVPEPEAEQTQVDDDLINSVNDALNAYEEYMEKLDFGAALKHLWKTIDRANKYIDLTQPWVLAKDPEARGRLATVLYNLLEILRLATIGASPILPCSAQVCWQQLGLQGSPASQSWISFTWGNFPVGTKVKRGESVFPRMV